MTGDIVVSECRYYGVINRQYPLDDYLPLFSASLEFGKSYQFNSRLGRGSWAASWIIGGLIHPFEGSITLNGNTSSLKERLSMSWCYDVREIKTWGRKLTVRQAVRKALEKSDITLTEEEIREKFQLYNPRYDRFLSQQSQWYLISSTAIGYARGKTIFCFPYLDYTIPYFFEEYNIEPIIKTLTDDGALVIVPAMLDKFTENLCDEVIDTEKRRY